MVLSGEGSHKSRNIPGLHLYGELGVVRVPRNRKQAEDWSVGLLVQIDKKK